MATTAPPLSTYTLSALAGPSTSALSTSPRSSPSIYRSKRDDRSQGEELESQIRRLRESYAPAWGAIPTRDRRRGSRTSRSDEGGRADAQKALRGGLKGKGKASDDAERPKINVVEAPRSGPRSSDRPRPSGPRSTSGSSTDSSRSGSEVTRCPVCQAELRHIASPSGHPASSSSSPVHRTPLFEDSDEEDEEDQEPDESAIDDAEDESESPSSSRHSDRRLSSFDFSPKHLSPLSPPYRRPFVSSHSPSSSAFARSSRRSSADDSGVSLSSASGTNSFSLSFSPHSATFGTPPSSFAGSPGPGTSQRGARSFVVGPEVSWGPSQASYKASERKRLLLEAKAWPIFARRPDVFDSRIDPSTTRPCESCGWQGREEGREQRRRAPVLRRTSSAGRLSVPAVPLQSPEDDPLLSTSSSAASTDASSPSAPGTSPRQSTSPTLRQHSSLNDLSSLASDDRPAPAAGGKKESLLTKSLRQLGGRLPNLQWGSSLAPTVADPASWLGPVPPAMLVSSPMGSRAASPAWMGLLGAEGLIGGEVLPPNPGSGAWHDGMEDPEMEWCVLSYFSSLSRSSSRPIVRSSMMVQLQTFSAPPPEPAVPASEAVTKPSKMRRRSKGALRTSASSSSLLATSPPRPHSPISGRASPGERSLGPPRETAGEGTPLGPADPDAPVAPTRRLLSNPYHLLQLTLELEMMRVRKIRGPLRQRAVKVVVVFPEGRSSGRGGVQARQQEVWVSVGEGSARQARQSSLRQEVVLESS